MSSRFLVLVLLAFFTWGELDGQVVFPHTELDWRTIETEHFLVHTHTGAMWTGRTVAAIAESIYAPVTGMYGHRPDQKVSIVIRDHDDYSNGAAYFFDNKIEIWAPAMDFELRGIHPWLQNVVTHEFVHIVQIQAAMKLGRRIPALYLQWFGYESERRPDVLYGYPNVVVSYPFSFFLVPSWFAEGTAQYNHPSLTYDFWDTHRDMILRMNVLEGNLLSWEDMAVFGKTSLGNESAYNAGFSLVRYIAETYGVGSLERISRALASLPRVTIDGAIEQILGRTGREIYAEWKSSMDSLYGEIRRATGGLREGAMIDDGGFGNFYPVFGPDHRSILYVSNKGKDYFAESSVYIYDPDRKKSEMLVKEVRSTLSLTPDGNTLVYAKISSDNAHWSRWSDLYAFNMQTKRETRITYGLRAFNPRLSPDGSRIVFTYGSDGTLNIGTCRVDGTDIRELTSVSRGHQVYTPVWSPDGSKIAFGYSQGHGQSIGIVEADGGEIQIVAANGDCRNPFFASDGTLYFSSDRTGIFNIYSLDLRAGATKQITNVLGGAFLPAVNNEGDLLYASYSSSGYAIRYIPASEVRPEPVETRPPTMIPGPFTHSAAECPSVANPEVEAHNEGRAYRHTFTSLNFFPILRFDNYNPRNSGVDILKPGLYVSSYDMLEKLTLFAGAALNRRFERDIAVILEYRDRLPLISTIGLEPVARLELYNLTRKTSATFFLEPSPKPISPQITYNLFEFNLSLRQPVVHERMEMRTSYTLSRYHADIGAFIDPNRVVLVPAFRNVYFIGNAFSVQVRGDYRDPGVESEINPTGRSVIFRYAYENNKFNPEGEFDFTSGLAVPLYQRFVFHRAEFSWNEYAGLPFRYHTLTLSLRAAGIIGKTVDSFFDVYAGGLVGMKGYPFYSLGGNTNAAGTLTYRFPISRKLDFRFLQFFFTKLYASAFVDFGNAWTGKVPRLTDWKSDAGFELRLEAFSFYAYPTRFFFSGAYGFDEFTRTFAGIPVRYGHEWRWYFGVLFGFELGQIVPSWTRFLGRNSH
jgi:Tol biopolymer transport system component